MKPHSLRRLLFLLNLVLAAAVVGLGVLFFTKVQPAVAKTLDKPRKYTPPMYGKLVDEYRNNKRNLRLDLPVAVKKDELTRVILRPDYADRDHWIFSGPTPPPPKAKVEKKTGPPPPQGLDTLGSVAMVIWIPPDESAILFRFHGGNKATQAFRIGEFVRKSKTEPNRFKLTDVQEVEAHLFKVVYEVYDAGKEEPVRKADVLYDSRPPEALLQGGVIRPLAMPKDKLADPAAAGGGAPESGTSTPTLNRTTVNWEVSRSEPNTTFS